MVSSCLGAKISSKAMLTFTSALGLLLVFLAIFSSTGSLVNLPVLQQSATGGLSFGFAEVPINAMYLVLVGLCTSIMWGGIFNLAVEGLGKYLAAASGLFMVLVCGGGILPVIQGLVAGSRCQIFTQSFYGQIKDTTPHDGSTQTYQYQIHCIDGYFCKSERETSRSTLLEYRQIDKRTGR
jgi:fucose permease